MIEINRRSFMGIILASAVAPAIVRASSLMPVRGIILPNNGLLVPERDFVSLDGSWHMAGPSFADITEGKTSVVMHEGIRFHAYRAPPK